MHFLIPASVKNPSPASSSSKTLLPESWHGLEIMTTLHQSWLPVAFRTDFKILWITYKALRGLAPSYITDLLLPYVPSRTQRSSDTSFLVVPRSRLIHKGDRGEPLQSELLDSGMSCPRRSGLQILLLILTALLMCVLLCYVYSVITAFFLFYLLCLLFGFVKHFWKVSYTVCLRFTCN